MALAFGLLTATLNRTAVGGAAQWQGLKRMRQ
jgi:hypothetical protein